MIKNMLETIKRWYEIHGIEIVVDNDSEGLYYFDEGYNLIKVCNINEVAMTKVIDKHNMYEYEIII